ncbi:MAG TPA: hypothetical protein VGE39_08745 [Prosthecobacter sp.]
MSPSRFLPALRLCALGVSLFFVTSCGSLWAQYQQKKLDLMSQLATKQISKSTFDRKMAELDKWYANGGSNYAGRRTRSSGSSSTKKSSSSGGADSSSHTPPPNDGPATSTADTPYPRAGGIDQISRRNKSGINEF